MWREEIRDERHEDSREEKGETRTDNRKASSRDTVGETQTQRERYI